MAFLSYKDLTFIPTRKTLKSLKDAKVLYLTIGPKGAVSGLLEVFSRRCHKELQNRRARLALALQPKIGALIIQTGLWGPLYYNYNKEPPK